MENRDKNQRHKDHRHLTVEEALALSEGFRTAAVAVGDYLYDKQRWPTFPEKERTRLASLVVTLFNLASDLIIEAGILVLVDAGKTIAELNEATALAKRAVAKIGRIGAAIEIATALIGLAAAIPTGNPATILGAAAGVREAVDDADDGTAVASAAPAASHAGAKPS